MREKLIELISQVQYMGGLEGRLADYLLKNGVIVPPCKAGDDLYWIDPDTNEIRIAEADIKAVCYYGNDEFKIICKDESSPEDIGTVWAMLTREEAEKKLAERSVNENG